ncbi:MAG: putative surface-exposed virulence protein [Actinomycetota bacterium]|nr:putative surface-exposed virulence protein [Actinomycetota bacterium]
MTARSSPTAGSMSPRWRLAVAAVLLVAAGAACSGGNGSAAGRLSVDGRAEVAAPGEKAKQVKGSRTIEFGQRVTVIEGTAVLRLDRDRQLELRAGSSVVLQETKEGGRRVAQPLLLEHDLLVKAPPGARLTVSTEGTDVVVSGGAQVSRGPVLVVSSYDGAVELRSGAGTVTVPALRQVSIAAGSEVPEQPSPLSYEQDDAWDRRFLSDAIELGNELEARSKGFSAQVTAADGNGAEFLIGLLPALGDHPEVTTLFQPERAPGESLVGAAVVLEGTRGTFAERWAGVFGFRDQGAQWGLVALDQGVTRAPLLARVDAALARGPRPFEPVPLPGPESDGGVALPAPSNGSSGPPRVPAPTVAPSATTSVPVPTTLPPGPGPLNTGVPILDNTINALVATLSGLLRSLAGG